LGEANSERGGSGGPQRCRVRPHGEAHVSDSGFCRHVSMQEGARPARPIVSPCNIGPGIGNRAALPRRVTVHAPVFPTRASSSLTKAHPFPSKPVPAPNAFWMGVLTHLGAQPFPIQTHFRWESSTAGQSQSFTFCASQPFLCCPHRREKTRSDWANIVSTAVAGALANSQYTCRAWHAMLGRVGGTVRGLSTNFFNTT